MYRSELEWQSHHHAIAWFRLEPCGLRRHRLLIVGHSEYLLDSNGFHHAQRVVLAVQLIPVDDPGHKVHPPFQVVAVKTIQDAQLQLLHR